MKPDFSALAGAIHLSDGAWSTELHARGFPRSQPAELANIEDPGLVLALAHDYLAAGAEFLSTNTFAAGPLRLAQRGLSADSAELIRSAARLARRAVDEFEARVVGVIGPSGRILAVHEISPSELASNFAEQARILAGEGADALLLETFSEPAEAALAAEAARQAAGLPIIASFSFDSGPQHLRTLMGADVAACAAAAEAAGADVIGCNCGIGIAAVLPVVVALRQATSLPLWVKPSVGLPELEDGRAVYRQAPEESASFVALLFDAGANVLGGCCGAGPDHIRRMAGALEARRRAGRKR